MKRLLPFSSQFIKYFKTFEGLENRNQEKNCSSESLICCKCSYDVTQWLQRPPSLFVLSGVSSHPRLPADWRTFWHWCINKDEIPCICGTLPDPDPSVGSQGGLSGWWSVTVIRATFLLASFCSLKRWVGQCGISEMRSDCMEAFYALFTTFLMMGRALCFLITESKNM